MTWRGYFLTAVLCGWLVGWVWADTRLAHSLPVFGIVIALGWLTLPLLERRRW